jgi:thiol-disulfide isomerase/thioredoxin
MRKNWLLVMPLALAAMATGVWLAQTHYVPEPHAPSSTAALWELDFPDLNGQPQTMSQWRRQVLVLNFWASWCAPCREEIPDFVALRAQYQPQGVEFVGIAIDNAASVTQFLQQTPVNYPILIGEGAALGLARHLGNPNAALPYTIVLDRDGNIVLSHLGRLPRATLENALRQIASQL